MDEHRKTFESFAEKISGFDSVEEVKLFGSVAREEHGVNSDVDVLVVVKDFNERERIEEAALETVSEKGIPVTPVIVDKDAEKTDFLETVGEESVSYVRT